MTDPTSDAGKPRPNQIVTFDQAHATVAESLDALVHAHAASLAAGESRELTIVGQGVWLRDNLDVEALSEHLTVAVDRLAEHAAERDQLRYERRLLGVARRTLDLVAAGDLTRWEHLRAEAGDVAQRIVDEIGHPVTDEPPLGPDLRAENARLTARVSELLATIAASENASTLVELRAEVADLRRLFGMQWDRMADATARWRAEDPEARALIMPDLGDLLRWLMDRADKAEATKVELAAELAGRRARVSELLAAIAASENACTLVELREELAIARRECRSLAAELELLRQAVDAAQEQRRTAEAKVLEAYAAGWAAAVAALRSVNTYKQWHQQVLTATGVDHHRWHMRARHVLARYLEAVAPEAAHGEHHSEAICHRCGRPNIIWTAPSPLWNAVMRGGSINGTEQHDGIVCPACFAQLAEAAGITGRRWRFWAEVVNVELETVTPSGRVWDERAWLWREPGAGGADTTGEEDHG